MNTINRNHIRIAPLLFILSMLSVSLLPVKAEAQNTQRVELAFNYIHGFGGDKQDPAFCQNMREYIETTHTPCRTENYPWDSVKVQPIKPGASWIESQQRATHEASRYRTRVIERYEREQIPYVLVGFSIGSRVILDALAQTTNQLQYIEGVYFLGSAMTNDASISSSPLPTGMRITNYHSPNRDKVHSMAFTFMSDSEAGGRTGFSDTNLFHNLPVCCTHAHKGVGVHIDYSQLAQPIAEISLSKRGITTPGTVRYNSTQSIDDKNSWWNTVLLKEMPYGESITIEQSNLNSNYYRAIRITEGGKRERVARGYGLQAVLGYAVHKSRRMRGE